MESTDKIILILAMVFSFSSLFITAKKNCNSGQNVSEGVTSAEAKESVSNFSNNTVSDGSSAKVSGGSSRVVLINSDDNKYENVHDATFESSNNCYAENSAEIKCVKSNEVYFYSSERVSIFDSYYSKISTSLFSTLGRSNFTTITECDSVLGINCNFSYISKCEMVMCEGLRDVKVEYENYKYIYMQGDEVCKRELTKEEIGIILQSTMN